MNQFMKDVVAKIKMEEGVRLNKYECSKGYDTIGVGTKLPLTDDEMELISKNRGVKFNNPYPNKIYDEEADMLLWERLHPIVGQLASSKLYKKAPYHTKIVMIDMSYQMGFEGFCGFEKMIKAISDCNFGIAGEELLDSLYANQTPNRANRNAKLLRKYK